MTSQVPEDTAAPHRPRPRTRWIAALAFIVVAGLIAGLALLLRPQPPASSLPAATPQQAVTGYLDALGAADAERALAYALNRPTDTALLTREMLEASHRTAALSVVDVPAVEGTETATVPARVRFGETAATITFSLTHTEAGWRLGQVTSTIDPGPIPAELGVTLNGQPLTDPAHLEVFPGVYTFAEKSPALSFGGAKVTVAAVGEDVRAGLQPTLTATGEKRASSTAAAALKACMAKKSPAPANCPNSVAIGKEQKVDAKSIKWTLVGNPWKDAAYTVDLADPTHARGAAELTFRFRCNLTQNGEKYTVDQTNSVNVRYLVSVTNSKDPVAWQRVA